MNYEDVELLAARVSKIEDYLQEKFSDFDPIVSQEYDEARGYVFCTQREAEAIEKERAQREKERAQRAKVCTVHHKPVMLTTKDNERLCADCLRALGLQ